MLDGARGRPKADVDALADLLMKVSQMACEVGDRVSELYFVRNPAKLTRLSGEGASLSR